ncbi:MAG TPA: hypothetical protein IAB51_10445 [Candidatus Merdivicinus excrementipullorum]|mgnify:CR=1 FL=1|uniref:Uncharacterized protein n=1 Tax=Candidatus Merdivicinus excrementipullorum TaxID=2840867 RepID=A0A9D1FNP4_9FIRM|nr:hypothetical protein [Candidatus Merdivicinus excrementipullorum]
MYKKILFMTVVSLFTATIMASCTAEPSTSSNETVDSQVTSSEENTAAVDEESSEIALESSETEEVSGYSANTCVSHTFSYHSISAELINYVGEEEGHAWTATTADESNDPYNRIGEDMTILAFIENFDIPKETFIEVTRSHVTDDFLDTLQMTREEYYEEFGYTDEQIDALYSGDQDSIDRAFCGPLAFINESDQKVYSIYWLADHSAEDYIAAQLPLERVEEVLQTASEEEYSAYSEFVSAIEPKLEQAYALAEQENSAAE